MIRAFDFDAINLRSEPPTGDCPSGEKPVARSTAPPFSATIYGIAAWLLTVSPFAGICAKADEFDPLAIYSEARPLNDRWQACAATFVKPRLRSRQAPDALAKGALDSCRREQDRLRQFFVSKIGQQSAENVIALLRRKYQSDLTTAINQLRTRD